MKFSRENATTPPLWMIFKILKIIVRFLYAVQNVTVSGNAQ